MTNIIMYQWEMDVLWWSKFQIKSGLFCPFKWLPMLLWLSSPPLWILLTWTLWFYYQHHRWMSGWVGININAILLSYPFEVESEMRWRWSLSACGVVSMDGCGRIYQSSWLWILSSTVVCFTIESTRNWFNIVRGE